MIKMIFVGDTIIKEESIMEKRKKKVVICAIVKAIQFTTVPFNSKNPHTNIKHIAEQFEKLNISVDEINGIELILRQ